MVSLAGPFMNFILAFLSLLFYGLLGKYGSADSVSVTVFIRLLYYSAVMNIGLGVFNLIPIPPLDGSNVLAELWPGVSVFYQRIRPYRTWILVILLASGALSRPLGTANAHIFNTLSPYTTDKSVHIMPKRESGLPGSRCRFPGTRLLILKQMSENPSHKRPRKKYLPAERHGKVQNRCLKPFCDNLGIHPFKKKRSDKTHQRTHDTHRHG